MIVIMMASTPSLNASSRFFSMPKPTKISGNWQTALSRTSKRFQNASPASILSVEPQGRYYERWHQGNFKTNIPESCAVNPAMKNKRVQHAFQIHQYR